MQDSLPAGWLAFTGWELNPLVRDERFPSCYISSPFPGFILTLDGHEHGGRLGGSGEPPARASDDNSEGSSPSGAEHAPQPCIRSIRKNRNHDAVMRISGKAPGRRVQPAQRLRSHGFTSDHRHLGSSSADLARAAKSVIRCSPRLLITMPDVGRCHPILHPSWRDARAR